MASGQAIDFINSNIGYNSIERNTTLGGLQINTGGTASLNILDNNDATFAGDVDSQRYTVDGAGGSSYQDFRSKPITATSGLFTVGGSGMQNGYSRSVSMWSSTDGVWNSWVGTNLRWDGTNFKRASDNGGQNWGNIAGIRFLGNSTATGTGIKIIVNPPVQSSPPSGEQTIGTSLPDAMTAVSINNDLGVMFAGNVGIGVTSASSRLVVNGNGIFGTGGTGTTDGIISIDGGSGTGGEASLKINAWRNFWLYIKSYSFSYTS